MSWSGLSLVNHKTKFSLLTLSDFSVPVGVGDLYRSDMYVMMM